MFSFIVLLMLTLLSSWVGDDDVVYKLFDRKPIGNEGIARLRFVLVKLFASVTGGKLLAILAAVIIKVVFSIMLSGTGIVWLMVLCIALMALFIGLLQNIIRSIQGRKIRPVFDIEIIKFNLKLWVKPRN